MYCYEPALFVADISLLPLCAVCLKVPRDAFILSCGHNAGSLCVHPGGTCKHCVQGFEQNDHPQLVLEIPNIDVSEAAPNHNLRAHIAVLLIRCPHKGCTHNKIENPIKVAEYDQHEVSCAYKKIPVQESSRPVERCLNPTLRLQTKVTNDECEVCLRIIPAEERLEHVLYEQGYCMTSDNGYFIWPVNKITEARTQAMDRVTRAKRSQAFFTSPNGYTLCVILYPDGDEDGLHTHISVYVVVMCGVYDNTLVWPFQQKISLTLRNLVNPDNNITRIVYPQDYPQCFVKPSRNIDMNDKAGFPRFASQSEVFSAGSNFIDLQDDALFLEVSVEPLP